jgi:hypothetical protein
VESGPEQLGARVHALPAPRGPAEHRPVAARS